MICEKCNAKMYTETVGFNLIYECPSCYNVSEMSLYDYEEIEDFTYEENL